MKDQSYSVAITVPATAQHVFVQIAEVSKWWTTDFEGSAAKLNGEFVICHPGAHYSKQRVTEAVPGKKLVWLVTDSTLDWLENKHEWTNTKMIFELTADDGTTTINFTHEGLVPGLECYDRCTEGWGIVIKNRLFNFITGQQVNNQVNPVKYTVAIELPQSPEVVFDHVVDDISKYWPEDFEGSCSKLNDEFVFRSGGDSHYSKHLVTEFVAGKKVTWLVTESLRKSDGFDWSGTKMIFDLTKAGENTLLEFTYDGFVLKGEYERLVQICDIVIKVNLYNFITGAKNV